MTRSRFPVPSKYAVLHVTALIVALCSFAYELVYSELLTIMYGGTVTQYGLTIGLFFSSLGVGSYLSQHLDDSRPANFLRVQLYLAISAPAGFLFILWLNTANPLTAVPPVVTETIARLPVVVVGVLSGFELPLLLSLVNRTDEQSDSSPTVERILAHIDRACHYGASLLFHTDTDEGDYHDYSTVLAMDYLGGLAGALIYVFYLYPTLGLIPSIFCLALLNGVAALLFAARLSSRPWGVLAAVGDSLPTDGAVSTREGMSVFVSLLLVTTLLTGAVVSHDTVDRELSEYYLEGMIENEYPADTIDASVTNIDTTKHQQVVDYERQWKGDSQNRLFAGSSEQCMRLDTAVQLCESWADSYHHGLVDVPMTLFENSSNTNVLLVGGGDWIAVNYLRDHNVSVDQVDLDGEFMEAAKTDSLLRQYHDDAYQYDRLDTHQADAYSYLAESDKQYDLILLDLPGATSDDALRLYSTEFYTLLNEHLADDGVLGTWVYSKYTYGEHHKAYLNTVVDAGFTSYLSYWAHDDLNNDGTSQLGERFYLFAPDDRSGGLHVGQGTSYVKRYDDAYAEQSWATTPTYDGVAANSIFHPNYDIIIDS